MTVARKHFRLSGHSVTLDERAHAIRADLADLSLAGTIFAPHYAEPVTRVCLPPHAAMFDKPGGTQTSELLAGEGFALLDISGGFAWGYSEHDHYVGYVEATLIGEAGTNGATPAKATTGDAVDTGRQFIDMPYLWGGRGGAGIDCSGLVQRSLAAVGIAAPRDSDMQEAALGETLGDDVPLQRGDLVFLPGHVGLMVDESQLLHATRFHGRTVIEPLADVAARFAARHEGSVTIVRKRISQ